MVFGTDYEGRMAAVYHDGRPLNAEAKAVWDETIRRFLPAGDAARVVDVGSGTGRFSIAFTEWLPEALIVGVEPAAAMRAVAQNVNGSSRVRYLGGRAESLPLITGSCDATWMSYVLHHVQDRPAAAREFRRVLRPGGRAMVVGGFRDQERAVLFDYFPSTREVTNAVFPSTDEVIELCAQASLRLVSVEIVVRQIAGSLAAYCEQMKLRAVSTLEAISDDEFHAGIARMAADAARQDPPEPVTGWNTMIVLERP